MLWEKGANESIGLSGIECTIMLMMHCATPQGLSYKRELYERGLPPLWRPRFLLARLSILMLLPHISLLHVLKKVSCLCPWLHNTCWRLSTSEEKRTLLIPECWWWRHKSSPPPKQVCVKIARVCVECERTLCSRLHKKTCVCKRRVFVALFQGSSNHISFPSTADSSTRLGTLDKQDWTLT